MAFVTKRKRDFLLFFVGGLKARKGVAQPLYSFPLWRQTAWKSEWVFCPRDGADCGFCPKRADRSCLSTLSCEAFEIEREVHPSSSEAPNFYGAPYLTPKLTSAKKKKNASLAVNNFTGQAYENAIFRNKILPSRRFWVKDPCHFRNRFSRNVLPLS